MKEDKYEDFKKAYLKLEQFANTDDKSEKSISAIIHAFEFTFELWWKCLQDYLQKVSTLDQHGPAVVIRKAYNLKIISDGQKWMDMLTDRNLTSHTYRENVAKDIYNKIIQEHIPLFKTFIEKFDAVWLICN